MHQVERDDPPHLRPVHVTQPIAPEHAEHRLARPQTASHKLAPHKASLGDLSGLSARERFALYPKTAEYPTFEDNGDSVVEFIEAVDRLIAISAIPDAVIRSKLPHRLLGSAQQWFTLRLAEPDPPITWLEWKAALRDRFQTAAWRASQQEQLRTMVYTGAEDPASWLDRFCLAMRSAHPTVTSAEIQAEVRARIQDASMVTALTALVGRDILAMSAYQQVFEEAALRVFPQAQQTQGVSTSVAPPTPVVALREPRGPVQRAIPPVALPPASRAPQAAAPARPLPVASGPARDSRACFNCGEVGHLIRDCPDPPSARVQALVVHDAQWDGSGPGDEEYLGDPPHPFVDLNINPVTGNMTIGAFSLSHLPNLDAFPGLFDECDSTPQDANDRLHVLTEDGQLF